MRVAVVLVNYGQWELTRKCIDSLDRSRCVDISITLIDNCSPGPVPSWVSIRKDLRFRQMDKNRGFAGGNNAGFQMAVDDQAEYTFFLNNDAEVAPETVVNMARYLRDNRKVGIVAPFVYWASEPERLWSAGGKLVKLKMRFEQVNISEKEYSPNEGVPVDFVSGCAMMIRTDLFSRIGGFREDFFMYYEDADLCRKVIEQGYLVEVLPSETVLHSVASGSGGELSKIAIYFSERNRIVLSRDMLSPSMRFIFVVYKSAVLIVMTVKFLLLQSPELIPCIWRGYFDGLAGRTGYSDVIVNLI
ncbi:MAG: glycosyltransferase family 2 protein [Candidatus Aegiribacteria sp.]|nr:glycosyltransferase family 2 protein [Candidatus Aegiribacteria sp.]